MAPHGDFHNDNHSYILMIINDLTNKILTVKEEDFI